MIGAILASHKILGATPIGNKYQRIHRDRQKHYVVFLEWNQSECTNTGGARCRSVFEKF